MLQSEGITSDLPSYVHLFYEESLLTLSSTTFVFYFRFSYSIFVLNVTLNVMLNFKNGNKNLQTTKLSEIMSFVRIITPSLIEKSNLKAYVRS